MKKKSMSTLASLAPRRRERGNNRNRIIEAQEDASPSLPTKSSDVDHARRTATPGTQDQTVDRLASALLESTIYHHPNGLASHPSVLLCGSEPVTHPVVTSSSQEPRVDVDFRHPVVVVPPGSSAASFQSRPQSETDEMVPAIPRKSSLRKAKRAKNINNSADFGEQALKKHLPQSKTTALHVVKKKDISLPVSTTAPLGGLAMPVDGRVSNANSHDTNANSVNDKIAAMLAATEALKPPGSQKNAATTSKPSRFRPKNVMSKVRQALDIFQPKPATPESKIRGKISGPVALTACDLPNPAAHYHIEEVEQASPVSSIEIRLNEGVNLNNQKVRSIVGGRILRKPVPDDGRSLRSGGSFDDPFSEQYELVRTPTPFEHRLKSSIDSSSLPAIPTINPFDAEKDFDVDLEGILSEKPLCASTPRNRNDKKAASLDSPSYRYAKPNDRHLTAVNEPESSSKDLGKRKNKLNLEGVRLFHDQVDLNVKKHPSPSKDELDDLETQFRAYAILQIKSAPAEERDELATKFSGWIGPNALTPRDKNIPMKARSAKEDTAADFSTVSERKYSREASALSVRRSLIPRPIEPASKIQVAPRFGLQRQPTNLDAMDLDELQ